MRIRWIRRCSMTEQHNRALHSGPEVIRAEIDVPPTPPDPNRPPPIPKTPPAPPTPTDEPPPAPVDDPPAESEPKPPYTVEKMMPSVDLLVGAEGQRSAIDA